MKKSSTIKESVTALNDNFRNIISNYNKVLLDNKSYSFNCDEVAASEIFGLLVDSDQVKNAYIRFEFIN